MCLDLIRPENEGSIMQPKWHSLYSLVVALVIILSPAIVNAALVTETYELDNVVTSGGGGHITGQFTWIYDESGDFENGTGEFTSLNVFNVYFLEDVTSTIEPGQIEINLAGNFDDQGLDVALVLLEDFSLNTSAPLNLDPLDRASAH